MLGWGESDTEHASSFILFKTRWPKLSVLAKISPIQNTSHKQQQQSFQLPLPPPSTWSASSSSNLLPLPCWQLRRASTLAATAMSHHLPPARLFADRSWTKTKERTRVGGAGTAARVTCPLAHPTVNALGEVRNFTGMALSFILVFCSSYFYVPPP